MASEKVLTLSGSEIASLKGVTLVDFWAPWCGPCRMMAPIIDALAEEYDGVAFGKINIDEDADAAVKNGVASIPTMVIFKDGVEQERVVGARNRAAMKAILDKYAK